MSSNPDLFTNKPPDTSLLITTMEQPTPSVITSHTSQPSQLHAVGKHQMLPVVVIQAQGNQKIATAMPNAVNSNMISLPQILPVQQMNNKMVLGKTPLVLQKAPNMPKNGVTYVTMLKPVSKPPDSVLTSGRIPITTITNMSKLKAENSNTLQVLNNPKIMIAPMPNVTTNRLPVTATTNSVQSKISFVPLVPSAPKGKVINFKLPESNTVKKEDLAKFVDLTTGTDLTITAVPEEKKKSNDESYTISVGDECLEKRVQPTNQNPTSGVSLLRRPSPFTTQAEVKVEGTGPISTTSPALCNIKGNLFPANLVAVNAGNTPCVTSIPTPDKFITISDPKTKEVQIATAVPDLSPLTATTSFALSSAPTATTTVTAPITIKDEVLDPVASNSVPATSASSVATSASEALSTVASTPIAPAPPPKRSRKSTLCLRKDYHEIEVQVFSKNTTMKILDLEEEKRHDKEVDEINSGADPFDFSSLLDEDFTKIFEWKHNIGKLPGSNLKFIVNEFGFLEYLTQDEYNEMYSTKTKSSKDDKKSKKVKKESTSAEEQEELRCFECGCFGMLSEFINPKYCSLNCHATHEKKAIDDPANCNHKKKRTHSLEKVTSSSSSSSSLGNQSSSLDKQEKNSPSTVPTSSGGKKRKVENGDREQHQSSDDDSSIKTDASHEKYPWHCKTKGFSWSKYLAHINAIGAPVKLFKDAFPYTRNGFRPGMKLEGVDPSHPSYFCVLTVAQVQGYRLQLHFDGYPKNYDFWVNADSMDIFPAGFCEKHDHVLQAPPNFPEFNWISYLKHTKAVVAPKNLFTNRPGSAIFPTAFRVGMKLEAVDRKNTSLVCVATAKDLMDNRILVHFDSWDDIYDYWADPTSPYIHPVGWCDKNGHNLTPPNDYPDPENFTWEKYLKETNSVAAPVRAFKQRPPSGFKKGMRLECVDKRVPQLIRVACVVEVKNHRLRVAFDGWPDRYSYWVDDDSSDIHPVGWCQKTGHPLEPPLTPDDVYDFMECATIGCRGVGNMKGPIFSTHSSLKYCPYAEDNIDIDSLLPDRLLSPDRELQAVVPVSREPRKKPGRKKLNADPVIKTEWTDQQDTDPSDSSKVNSRRSTLTTPDTDKSRGSPKSDFKIKSSNSTPAPSPPASVNSQSVSIKKESPPTLSHDVEVNLEELNMRIKHSKYLKTFADNKSDPFSWSPRKVVSYVQSLPFASHNADAFDRNAIDGESFLMLTQEDLVDVLNYKLGPAIALYNCILLLRKNVNGFSS